MNSLVKCEPESDHVVLTIEPAADNDDSVDAAAEADKAPFPPVKYFL